MTDNVKHPQEPASSLNVGQMIRLVIVTVLVVITVLLVLDNREDVTVGWVLGDTTASLALALAVTFILGLAVGWLGGYRRQR